MSKNVKTISMASAKTASVFTLSHVMRHWIANIWARTIRAAGKCKILSPAYQDDVVRAIFTGLGLRLSMITSSAGRFS